MDHLAKSIILFFIIIVFAACEKIPDGIIEQNKVLKSVNAVIAPANFSYSPTDSMLTTTIEFGNTKNFSKVWLKIRSEDGTKTIIPFAEMFDNGNLSANGDRSAKDNIFSAKVGISKKNSNGKYSIEYYVEDNINPEGENVAKVAVHLFLFNNNQVSFPPVISNLTIPNSVARGESFIFTVKAEDQNGLADISQVYFKLFRPDGSQVDPQNGLDYFLMVDDGNLSVFGDQSAGDGIYSFKNSFGTTSQTGNWKFEFQAKDKGGNLSNIIIHNMSVN